MDGLLVELWLAEEVVQPARLQVNDLQVVVSHAQEEAALVFDLGGGVALDVGARHNDLHFSHGEAYLPDLGAILP